MPICESCAGTFFPESLADVLSYRSLRHEKMEKPEAWHMTAALEQSLAEFLPRVGEANRTVALFGLPRCESEMKRLPAPPSAD